MINPEIFRIGSFAIRCYGVLIVGGALLAAYASSREAKRRGQDPEIVWDMLIWVLFCGIVGARLYHVFSTPGGDQLGWWYYREHPLEAFIIWRGGLAIYGALVGGIFGLATYCWHRHLDLVTWLDIVAPTVLLAQAVGRWGNFVNQEAYGYPTDAPWGLYISPDHRYPGFEQYSHFHPVFLYESIGCLIGFVLIAWAVRRFRPRLHRGDATALYFAWYGALRAVTESFRADAWRVGGIPTAQIISVVVVVGAIAFLVLRHTVLQPRATPADQAPE
ncbi:MAG: prolipoprotein diacylglyceryl transferase [Anaerolineae bacterium]